MQVHKQPVPFLFQLEGISSLLFLVIVFAAPEIERTQGLGRAKQMWIPENYIPILNLSEPRVFESDFINYSFNLVISPSAWPLQMQWMIWGPYVTLPQKSLFVDKL